MIKDVLYGGMNALKASICFFIQQHHKNQFALTSQYRVL